MDISQRDFGRLVQSYFVNVLLFGALIIFYKTSRYYSSYLSTDAQKTLITFYVFYIIAAIPLELLLPPERRRLEGKGLVALRASLRYVRDAWRYLSQFPLHREHSPTISFREKTAILFLLVKIYYLPIMVNFTFGNWNTMMEHWQNLSGATGNINDLLLGAAFPFVIALFLLIDTVIFTFGYTIEYPAANNEIRSVEPTLFGWGIALICYPPFNSILDNYLIWSADSNAKLGSLGATYILQILALLALLLYLLPSIALGPRASNLTNRGIVTWGPYAYIRHPAYTGKLIGWWLTSIPFLIQSDQFLLGFFSLCGWTTIYFFRALTEERHLIADPDYQEYCRRVRWRFIPFVF
jgi:protein-S-isoprenylcysteine O-methyltransferase Ste14